MDLTPDQVQKLQALGLAVPPLKSISNPMPNTSNITENSPKDITNPLDSPLTSGQTLHHNISSNPHDRLLNRSKNPIVPILSISGLTLISFGGLVLFKGKTDNQVISNPQIPYTNPQSPSPTQVPKSIQHYLLASQQYFTSALQAQTNQSGAPADLLNQSILAATAAIQQFPDDYRGYEQRARIYQSLIDSNPKLLTNAIADLSAAARLNSTSPEITRNLATLFAKSGDVQNTLSYLTQTISLEPTKAQNFYDLARLQTQAGYIPQALDTYNRLLTIVADPTQKTQVENEKASLEKLISQNPSPKSLPSPATATSPTTPPTEGPLLQADNGQGLIIAAPETSKNISVTSLTDSNSLAGTATLPANTPSLSVTNHNLTSSSQVYLTVTKGGKNQSLQVLSKSKDSFTVGLDSPISEDIEFKWWIVN